MLCTHVGSLPRPQAMVPVVRGEVPVPADWEDQLRAATAGLFAKQIEAGLDISGSGKWGPLTQGGATGNSAPPRILGDPRPEGPNAKRFFAPSGGRL